MTTTATYPDVSFEQNVPRDIGVLAPWLNIARRLRLAAGCGSHAVLRVTVLVDATGQPMIWSEPEVVRLEPHANGQALDALVSAFS